MLTDSTFIWKGAGLRQHAWVLRNCHSYAVRYKANVDFDRDGPCYNIAPWQTRTLEVKHAIPRKVYLGSKKC